MEQPDASHQTPTTGCRRFDPRQALTMDTPGRPVGQNDSSIKTTVASNTGQRSGDCIHEHAPPGVWSPPNRTELQRSLPLFEVIQLIGHGGMGAVYKARQPSLNRVVAIKILPPNLREIHPCFANRFKSEAQAMARLSHTNIVTVHDAGETAEGLSYIVMEFVEGTDLGKQLKLEGKLPPQRAKEIVCQICDALGYAHDSGVIHRDIKPSNIMLDKAGIVKVADFGLAKILTSDQPVSTNSGTVLGTPYYLAPESLIPGLKLDHRVDIYAVGVLLYAMLTGQVPQGRFRLPSDQVCTLPRGFDSIVERALQVDPTARYPTAAEFKRELAAISTQEVGHSFIWSQTNTKFLAGVSQGRRRFITTSICLLLLASLSWVFIGWFGDLHRDRGSPPLSPIPISTAIAEASLQDATRDRPYVNSIGMMFAPVPLTTDDNRDQKLLFSVWETRVLDYQLFVNAENQEWFRPPFEQGPTHPAINMNWDGASAFCAWLTKREQDSGRLPGTHHYRLPTDYEWSCAVGIADQESKTALPIDKSGKVAGLFPWGYRWPPLPGTGNFSGEEAEGHEITPTQRILIGYQDSYPFTAPVGSFSPNKFGLYDLDGNAREWCADWLSPTHDRHVVRGGSFYAAFPASLAASYRYVDSPEGRSQVIVGFRCVLAKRNN
ncbi:MAG: bifunctional serine/threonine-protein kinase/formylglycine-generating enzyme family protein [Verrucomicrobiales bacterium]